MKALDAGARGYLFKDNADEDIERHPWSSRPRLVFSLAITRALLEDYARRMRKRGVQDSYDLLTERERAVLQANKEATAVLHLSPTPSRHTAPT